MVLLHALSEEQLTQQELYDNTTVTFQITAYLETKHRSMITRNYPQ